MAVFRPDAHPETSSVDGYIDSHDLGGLTWETIRTGTQGDIFTDDAGGYSGFEISADANTDKWDFFIRGIISFDTSTLPDDITISSAVLSLHGGAGKGDQLASSPTVNIYGVTLHSDNNLGGTEAEIKAIWDSFGNTAYSTEISYASWDDAGWNDFTLNADGLASISKTGNTRFGFRNVNYDVSNVAPTWGAYPNDDCWIYFWTADYSEDLAPKLTVTYTTSTMTAGNFAVVETRLHYMGTDSVERYIQGLTV